MYRAIFISALVAGSAFAQAAPPAFEAVSIKPNSSGVSGSDMNSTPGRLNAVNITPRSLLLYAFGIRESQLLGGPDWLDKERFDLAAVTGTPIDLNRTTLPPYLQSMFADRFHLKFHRDTRESPVYSLVVAKGGPKLTPHSGEALLGGTQPGTGVHSRAGKASVNAKRTTMKRLAEVLGQQTDRFVIDHTGLSGEYDFDLKWSTDLTADAEDPSIFTAIQEQLGLKLEPAKGPVEVIVIDSVERPSEN